VPADGRANLEQFLQFDTSVGTKIQEHDRLVDMLTKSCTTLHETLTRRSPLPNLYAELTSEQLRSALEKHGRSNSLYGGGGTREDLLREIFGGYPPADHIAVLAQYVVNNAGDLPSHITTAPLWNEYRERFLMVLKTREAQKQYRATSGFGAQLMQTSDDLSNELQQIRLKLSIEHDVPYVEPSAKASGSDWYDGSSLEP